VFIFADASRQHGPQPLLTKINVSEARGKNAKQWRQNRKFDEMASLQPEILEEWLAKSKADGVDDGFSDWPYRLKGCGNSISPQIGEMFGRAILAMDGR
jgi:hypothetical protein